jgi:arabinan endo-1,5-alpha-L-arabinosidase
LTLEGQPAQLVKQDQAWEGNLVEAPTLWKQDGKYYLFYSANSYAGADYAVGYAVADALLGPYQKAEDPLLVTSTARGPILGPGGQDIVLDKDGETWIVYHSWEPRSITYRQVNIDELAWEVGVPVVKGPETLPQPVP